jgi:hypothetical protein
MVTRGDTHEPQEREHALLTRGGVDSPWPWPWDKKFVLPSGRVSGEWVQLSYVDERFVQEVDRMYGRSQTQEQEGWNNCPTVKVVVVLLVGAALILTLLYTTCFGGGQVQV